MRHVEKIRKRDLQVLLSLENLNERYNLGDRSADGKILEKWDVKL
jgi:hypothetical protein